VIALLIFVILIIVELVFGVVFVALGLGFVSQAAGGLQNMQAFFTRPPEQWIAAMTPGLIAFAVLSIPFNGVIYAIVSAPWARAYRDLAPPDVAATFA
jgi:hypothetical protein